MEKAVEKIRGLAQISVSGAEPQQFINLCAQRGVVLRGCVCVDLTQISCTVSRRYLAAAHSCAEQSGCTLEVKAQKGGGYFLHRIGRRYVLLAGMLLLVFLLGYSSLFVWDMEIEGNETIPDYKIYAALEECGVKIGANWTAFNSDLIRSGVLYRIPELSFISVNVSGSRAYVQVRERVTAPEIVYDTLPADIVAKKSGRISEIKVFRGHGLVSPGDEVSRGQTLVAGAVPGIELWEKPVKYRQVSSLAEIKAETEYEFTAFSPLTVSQKQYTGREAKNFALIISEKRLNFYKNTGIYRSSCDTIYYVWKLAVPDLFTLPVSLVCESRMQYELSPTEKSVEEMASELKDELLHRLHQELSEDAAILSTRFTVHEEGDGVYVTLKAKCLENIAEKIPMDAYPMEEEEDT